MVLEAGLKGGPSWAWVIMLIGAGLTALYTFRCVYLVFYGAPRSKLHGHDAGPAMKVALIPLAAGTLLTWLLVDPFSKLLAETLPAHGLEHLTLGEMVSELVSLPTLLALVVVALGLAAWWWRDSLTGLAKSLQGLGKVAADSFGFEAINRGVVKTTQNSAEALRNTQTGLLNWNVLGILAALIIVLAVVALGA